VYNGGGQIVAEYSTLTSQTPQVSYLTNDHLGSARVITNENGQVTTRKDYAAFGEELATSQRTTTLKYDASETRKGYTGYEKDTESGLEFAQARYYNAIHGRFTSVDPLTASATIKNPQTFNRYSYVLNSPYKFTDPLGLISQDTGACGQCGVEEPDGGGGYQDVSGSFLQDRIYQREVRTITVVQTESDGKQAEITITAEVDRVYDGRTKKLLETSNTRITEATAKNTGSTKFSNEDLDTMKNVAKDIVQVSIDKGTDPTLILAMAQRESHLGVGARKDSKKNNNKPEMAPKINPLQLDGDANKKYYASSSDRQYNIGKSIDLFRENAKLYNSSSLSDSLAHYNDGGKIGQKGKNYASDVLNKQRQISDKSRYVYGTKAFNRILYPPIY
jgi:RHS repeat-associated protein